MRTTLRASAYHEMGNDPKIQISIGILYTTLTIDEATEWNNHIGEAILRAIEMKKDSNLNDAI